MIEQLNQIINDCLLSLSKMCTLYSTKLIQIFFILRLLQAEIKSFNLYDSLFVYMQILLGHPANPIQSATLWYKIKIRSSVTLQCITNWNEGYPLFFVHLQ